VIAFVGEKLYSPGFLWDRPPKLANKGSGNTSSPAKLETQALSATEACLRDVHELLDQGYRPAIELLDVLGRAAGSEEKTAPHKVLEQARGWLASLHGVEHNQVSLLHRAQLDALDCPLSAKLHGFGSGADTIARQHLLLAWYLSRFSAIVIGGGGDNTVDTAINLMELADTLRLGAANRGYRVVLAHLSNRRTGERKEEKPAVHRHIHAFGELFTYLAGCDVAFEAVNNWTNVVSKSGGMNGLLVLPDVASGLRVIHVFDRNTNVLELASVLQDYERIWANPNLTILVAQRNTSNALQGIGRQNQAIEEGHGSALLGLPDKIGTGWANLVHVYFWDALLALANPTHPLLRLSRTLDEVKSTAPNDPVITRYVGIAGFSPNGLGQSEDLWSVFQQTHNRIGVGHIPAFGVTTATAVKLREHRSTFAVTNSGSRWARGLIDTLRSPIHQLIGIFGPESIFERKVRRSAERVYLSAPVGVMAMMLLFLGIMRDINPFVGVQLSIWIMAGCLSQSLTLHGLVASMRARGRGCSAAAFLAGLIAFVAAFAIFGMDKKAATVGLLLSWFATLTVYSPAGFSSWLLNRVLDLVIFGPRYFLEAVSILVGLTGATHLFHPSGRNDNRDTRIGLSRLFQLLSEREVNWHWPVLALALAYVVSGLALFALRAGLDLGNVMLMWIILVFVTGAALGLFTEDQRLGAHNRFVPLAVVSGMFFGTINVVAVGWGARVYVSDVPGQSAFGRWISILAMVSALAMAVSVATPRWVLDLSPGLLRFASTYRRCIVLSMGLSIWFAVVPIPDTIRFAAEPIAPFAVASIDQLIVVAAALFSLFAVSITVGWFYGGWMEKQLWRRFRSLTEAHIKRILEPYDRSRSPLLTQSDALLMQFLVKMGMGLWAEAERAMATLEHNEQVQASFPNNAPAGV
jgi:hypothetical protein